MTSGRRSAARYPHRSPSWTTSMHRLDGLRIKALWEKWWRGGGSPPVLRPQPGSLANQRLSGLRQNFKARIWTAITEIQMDVRNEESNELRN
jgi:hypothetical protein